VEVLEHAGYRVIVPQEPLCCGRPLFDYGMLDTAKVYFTQLIEGLAPYAREGIKVVGIEPSCVAAFRDELPNMMPHSEDGKRLTKNTLTLAEFLTQEGYEPPKLDRKALVHSHCHQEHIMGINAEKELYNQMGLDYEVLNSGCCGLAGSWGFERDKYDLSMQIGELGPLPAARNAERDTILMSDGFSCKTQIQQGDTGRRALHTAQVIKMAMDHGQKGTPRDEKPEEQYPDVVLDGNGSGSELKTAAIAGAMAAGILAWGLRRRR
jgi:Fe-S oxidoreductase